MRTRPEIIGLLAVIIEDVTLGNTQAESVCPDSAMMGAIGLDSLDLASVLLGGEMALSIKVNEEGVDWRKIVTVSDLAGLLYENQ